MQQQQQQYDPSAYAQQQPPGQQPVGQQPGQQPPPVGTSPSQQQPAYDPAAYAHSMQQAQPAQPQPAYDPNAYHHQQNPNPAQPGYDSNTFGAQQQPQPTSQEQLAAQPQLTTQSTPGEQPPVEHQGPDANGVYSVGPPYVYDPNGRYPDPNAQAWAQYYAQGGTDPQGAVYFHSVPGVKEPASASPPAAAVAITQPTPTQETHTAALAEQYPQQQQQQPQPQPHPQSPQTQTTTQLSPKLSPVQPLKLSPKSKRISMAGVGTVAQHPDLQSTLPTYAHEMQSKRPSSSGSQPGGVSAGGAPGSVMSPQQPWGQQPAQPVNPGARATSPSGGAGGPWAYQHPQINEPARASSTSPPAAAYRSGLQGYQGGVSPGGTFHPTSAPPADHLNQPNPYPTFRPSS